MVSRGYPGVSPRNPLEIDELPAEIIELPPEIIELPTEIDDTPPVFMGLLSESDDLLSERAD